MPQIVHPQVIYTKDNPNVNIAAGIFGGAAQHVLGPLVQGAGRELSHAIFGVSPEEDLAAQQTEGLKLKNDEARRQMMGQQMMNMSPEEKQVYVQQMAERHGLEGGMADANSPFYKQSAGEQEMSHLQSTLAQQRG